MDEGFLAGAHDGAANAPVKDAADPPPLNHRRARSAADPPRAIPNRVVKRGSADGTGGTPAGSVGPCAAAARRGAVAARRAHNPKVGGSNPPAATIYRRLTE